MYMAPACFTWLLMGSIDLEGKHTLEDVASSQTLKTLGMPAVQFRG